jgi:metallophosphoesterase superfamily enzyme
MAPLPPRLEIRPDVWLDARLALWLAAAKILIVADLHWGYAASHRTQGNLLPLWGDEEIAARLKALIQDYQPSELVWLGDSLHALSGRQGAENFLREVGLPVRILSGNHDKRWSAATLVSHRIDNFFLHHGDRSQGVPEGCLEIIGHHHPAFGWYDGAGARLKLPALIASSRRLILPAFSPWAAGTPWNDAVEAHETLFAIAPKRIFAVPPRGKSAVA